MENSNIVKNFDFDVDGSYIFAIGGYSDPKGCEVYNLKTETWTTIESTNESRFYSCAVTDSKRIFVTGGKRGDDDIQSSIEIYNPFNDSWSMHGQMSHSLYGHCMAVLNGDIYVAGGTGRFINGIVCLFYLKKTARK